MQGASPGRDLVNLTPQNLRIWLLLAFQAGAVNAGGYLACKRFVTHTTGFATLFGVELARDSLGEAAGVLSVPLFFLLGTMVTSYFVDLPIQREEAPEYRWPALLITLCLVTALIFGELGLFGIFGERLAIRRDYLFLVLLSLASGLQNALFTTASGVVVRTTHLTGITTDLGVSLTRLLFSRDRRQDTRRLDRRASLARFGIIVAFVVGAAASAFCFLQVQYLGFLLPVITSCLVLRHFLVRAQA